MHKLFINGRNDNKFFGCDNEYNAGDIVCFDALQPTDTSVHIRSEQLDRINRELVDHIWKCKFIMPNEDVYITIDHENTMMNRPMPGGMPTMGMMGMGIGMGMMQTQQTFGESQSTGESIKCACCGNICSENAKFCNECGYKLK